MKKIAIIGTGICGLRAGLELSQRSHLHIIFFEKSRSVGGRVATRRFDEGFVNHGADDFTTMEALIKEDPSLKDHDSYSLKGEATKVPKLLRDLLSKQANIEMKFSSKVIRVKEEVVTTEDGKDHQFDHILLTAPAPQVSEMLGSAPLPISYDKKILFIGPQIKVYFPDHLTDEYFDQSEEAIRLAAQNEGLHHQGLELKKWRYANVIKGVSKNFESFTTSITIAGDGFDPLHQYGLKAAWLSGSSAGNFIASKFPGA